MKGRIRDCWNSGLKGYRKEGIQESRVEDRRYGEEERCWTGDIHERRDAGDIHERRDAGDIHKRRDAAGRQEIFMRGVIQICFSNGAKEKCFCSMLQFRFGFAC